METDHQLILSFEGADLAEAGRFASELAEQLRDADAPIDVRVTRADPSAQDFGATLVLILGKSAVTALAKGVSAWLGMRPNARVIIKDKGGTLIARGLTSSDARAVIQQRLGERG